MTDRAVEMVCEFAVLQALVTAGKRGRLPRAMVGQLRNEGTPAHAVHTRVLLAHNTAECDRLISGTFDLLAAVLPTDDAARIVNACDTYTRELILTQRAPARNAIAEVLDHAVPSPSR
ncbi:hypothetical protein KNU62_gp14 [Gordonia phage Bakery]|uniref:Uncharacterized protein n=1 Tax=Gordonia phage Bakery TaxID=2591205 RepID=A0A514DGR9_9CAUD|nr:hypothetical protein KNU62_gp14 [Gordonia phage Bakery]QDH92799.1 hypothetical protein SEA_BAKERY_14 [Gordonia phage Bakery]